MVRYMNYLKKYKDREYNAYTCMSKECFDRHDTSNIDPLAIWEYWLRSPLDFNNVYTCMRSTSNGEMFSTVYDITEYNVYSSSIGLRFAFCIKESDLVEYLNKK